MNQMTSLLYGCVMLYLVAIVASAPGSPFMPPVPRNTPPKACSIDERDQLPCVCCKKDCWYTIAAAATHELGHMPGEAGENEALATLRLIRACMIEECGLHCMRQQF